MLQKIAQEMNLSDTGFILEKNSQDTYSQGQQTRNTIQLLIIGIKIGYNSFCKESYLAKNQGQGSRAEFSRLKYYHPTCIALAGFLLFQEIIMFYT